MGPYSACIARKDVVSPIHLFGIMSPFERYPSQLPTPHRRNSRAQKQLRVTMWFQLALYPDAPLLGVLVGSDNLLYFRIIDLGHLLGRKYGFAKQFPYDIVFGKDVLPWTQTYPRYAANARLVTQDTAYRILCRENRQLAERLSNAFDSD
ncbi:hypothetical protein TNCV_4410971 [Trichonephila clavipes]|nr:hypothetical protein TNCV_4410971 [Trichonephila clavipes]